MGMADSAKTSENARWRSRTARAHPIFDICDFILRSIFLKFQIPLSFIKDKSILMCVLSLFSFSFLLPRFPYFFQEVLLQILSCFSIWKKWPEYISLCELKTYK